ncbi:MAG TPA: hypothetical protein VMT20_07220 [Terriglobia bacterium]|nr:hypothetical protein [Terriglobia bacterium]
MRTKPYMKKVRNLQPHCECYINGEWQPVTRVVIVRQYSSDEVTVDYGYGSDMTRPGDFKLRYRESR